MANSKFDYWVIQTCRVSPENLKKNYGNSSNFVKSNPRIIFAFDDQIILGQFAASNGVLYQISRIR